MTIHRPVKFSSVVTNAMSPYQAIEGETTLVDTTSGNVTVLAPVNPVDDAFFSLKKLDASSNFVTVEAGAGDEIEVPFHIFSLGSSVRVTGPGQMAEWQFWDSGGGTDRWTIVEAHKTPLYAEAWQATPIDDISPSTTIQWTFAPLFPGQTPLLATHASGVFTLPLAVDIDTNLSAEWAFDSTSNNSELQFNIDAVYTGTGEAIFVRIVDSFQSSRAGVFARSGGTDGILEPVANDTISFVATEEFSTGMSLDLIKANLLFQV